MGERMGDTDLTDYYKYYFESGEVEGSAGRIIAKNELVYSLIAPHVRAAAPVLEIGVGKGYFAGVCERHGHPYRGIEANEEQCRALRDAGLEMTCGRVPPVPVSDESFGLVYSAHLIEHLPDSRSVHELLTDCRRLVGEDGVIALLFPDAMALGIEFWNCDYTHAWPTTENRVAQALADAGCRVVASHRLSGHYTGLKRLAARAGSRRIALRAMRAIIRDERKRELYLRAWLYLQQNILLLAVPAAEAARGGQTREEQPREEQPRPAAKGS